MVVFSKGATSESGGALLFLLLSIPHVMMGYLMMMLLSWSFLFFFKEHLLIYL